MDKHISYRLSASNTIIEEEEVEERDQEIFQMFFWRELIELVYHKH